MFRKPQFEPRLIGPRVMSPVLERELRTTARRPLFFWLRGLLALALGFQAYELLEHSALAPTAGPAWVAATAATRVLPGAAVLHHMAWLLFLAVLLMGLVSADSINRERREGTLGLLLLTDLSPAEIVRGQMLSCGINSFAVLLGALPALMIPVLAGGVSGSEAALIGIGLLNSLFVVLAAGLWMSALFHERRNALGATLGLVVLLAIGPELLGSSFFAPVPVPIFRLLGLAGWMTAAQMQSIFHPVFLGWLVLTNAVGWFFLWRAAATLAQTWQDQPHKQFRDPEPAEEWPEEPYASTAPDDGAGATAPEQREDAGWEIAGVAGRPRAAGSWLTDPRPWDEDPVRWRVERLGSPDGMIWLATALSFIAQFGALGALSGGAAPVDRWGLLSFASMGVIAFAGGLVAWIGARFFQHSRRHLDLELLLTTPLGARNILAGQWRVLRRALLWPIALLLALALPAGLSLLYDCFYSYGNDPWFLLQPFLIAVNLGLELVALCWIGMWFGLRCRNAVTTVTAAVGLVQVFPMLLAVGLMWLSTSLQVQPAHLARAHNAMPPVILALLLFLVKNAVLIVWARWRLRRELRLRRRRPLPPSPARLVPRPA